MSNFATQKLKLKYFLFLLIIFNCVSCQRLAARDIEEASLEETIYKKKYSFSMDHFTSRIPVWKEILHQFEGKPNIHYLEVGVFEGRATIWMLENILTHSTSKVTCVDIFPEDSKERLLANLKISGFIDKATIITGRSQIKLRNLPLNSFDIIYIDGSHSADDVLADAVLSWPLLKNDGLIIFDDYLLRREFPLELTPKFAIDAFITAYRNYLEIISRKEQVFIKKKELSSISSGRLYSAGRYSLQNKIFSIIGQYVYSWPDRKLYHLQTGRLINLSDTENELIKVLIKSRGFGETNFFPADEVLRNEEFLNLKEKLNLDFE